MTTEKSQEAKQLDLRRIMRAIDACLENADRLLKEGYDLEFRDPPASRYYLTMIAQEEIAKAFLLYLVHGQVIPLSPAVGRAMNDHACKQLVGIIMDYMIMHWEELEELNALIEGDIELGDSFPGDIGSAIEILRFEKIGRWEKNNWVWTEDPAYDKGILKIAEGDKDRRKQDAVYVRIGRDGSVNSTPWKITEQEMKSELERAGRYMFFVQSLLEKQTRSYRVEKTIDALKTLFSSPARR